MPANSKTKVEHNEMHCTVAGKKNKACLKRKIITRRESGTNGEAAKTYLLTDKLRNRSMFAGGPTGMS